MIEGLIQTVSDFLHEYTYEAAFTVLFLCGVGLPLPEEVTLIGSGILLYKGEVDFLKITLVCSAAILLGDSIPFWIGRRYGMSALRNRLMSKVLHPERLARIEARFKNNQNWTTFVFRFFAGVRIPGYFIAGTFGMSYPRFLLLDSLGVLVSVPISIWLGHLFGGQIDRLKENVHNLHLVLAFVALSLVVFMIVRAVVRKKNPSPPIP